MNDFLQVWLIGNYRYQVLSFTGNNWDDEVYLLIRRRKVLGDMKYLTRSVKQAAEALRVWAEDN